MLLNLFDSRLGGGNPHIYLHLHHLFHLSFFRLQYYLYLGPSINSNLLLNVVNNINYVFQSKIIEVNVILQNLITIFKIFVWTDCLPILHQTYPLFVKVAYDGMKKTTVCISKHNNKLKPCRFCRTSKH